MRPHSFALCSTIPRASLPPACQALFVARERAQDLSGNL